MPEIKLFVCCHQPTQLPAHPLLVPIQLGAALADARFPGFLHDDTGDNISKKNRAYCELTAQYWAWKNADADYYGFFHYRRYLYPDVNARRPYRIEREPTLPLLDKLGYRGFSELIQRYDLIVPKGENMYLPVREHYANAPFHHRKDLALVEEIVRRRHPDMIPALERHLSGTICYFGNIFIMKRHIFHDYCAWLFPLLEEFDHSADLSSYSPQERRVDGYLAERLLGIYLTAEQDGLRCLELPRVHFEPSAALRHKLQLLAIAIPPGTGRRAVAKAAERRAKRCLLGR